MPSYKLHYFDLNARGEPARQLFALANQPYEDVRYSMEEFAEKKKADPELFPFGQVPVLEVDGKPLAQSCAIYRYLGNKFGFAGENDFDRAQVDAIADLFQDYFNEYKPYFVVAVGFAQGDKNFLYNSVMVPARNKMFRILSTILKDNGTGYLVGISVTYVDIVTALHISGIEQLVPGIADDYPRLLEHRDRIEAIPAIRNHIANRPPRPF